MVSLGGPAEDPAYLPVHAAAALGTFEAEGVSVTLRRAKHPTAAVTALRDREAAVAVTSLDQAIRGAWARVPVRVLAAHTRAPAVVLLTSTAAAERVTRVADLRGRRVGIPGPGTTGHLLLAALLQAARLQPWQLDVRSLGNATLAARLGTGELAAAVVDEPWASRALAAGGAAVLADFRRPEDAARHLGGPFYEIVSVTAADPKELERLQPALAAFARAVIRVQAWLATAAPEEVAARLPPDLGGNRERLVARLGALRAAYAPGAEATEAGLAASLRILRGGSPWPASLRVTPADLREPGFVSAARAALGPSPPPP